MEKHRAFGINEGSQLGVAGTTGLDVRKGLSRDDWRALGLLAVVAALWVGRAWLPGLATVFDITVALLCGALACAIVCLVWSLGAPARWRRKKPYCLLPGLLAGVGIAVLTFHLDLPDQPKPVATSKAATTVQAPVLNVTVVPTVIEKTSTVNAANVTADRKKPEKTQ